MMWVIGLSSFLMPFGLSTVPVALPSLGRELGLTLTELNWIMSAFLMSVAVLLVPLGRLADIHGRRRLFLWGLGLFTAASLVAFGARSYGVLLGARVLQGAGAAMTTTTSTAILASTFRAGRMGEAQGVNAAAVYFGLSAGPFVGGLLTEHGGWRSLFAAHVLIGAVLLVFAARGLKADGHEERGGVFDWGGALLYAAALLCLTEGFLRAPSRLAAGLVAAGLAGFALFARREWTCAHPVLHLRLLARNRVFALSNLAALINYSATFVQGFLMSLYLQQIKGLSPVRAGTILVVQPILQALLSPLAGRQSDRIQPRWLASSGMAFCAAGLALFTFLREDTSLGFIVTGLALLGVGFALFSSPNTNAAMSSVEHRHYGVASASLSTMRVTGMLFSMAFVGLILGSSLGRVELTPGRHAAFLEGTRLAFGLLATLCALGILPSLARGPLKR